MSNPDGKSVTLQQATHFLADYVSNGVSNIELIGEGAWSRCYGFQQGNQQRAIRFGKYLDDFEKDQVASRYGSPALPIPQLFEIGNAFDGYYAISSRVHGIPLESVSATQWQALVPSLGAAMEAMRTADLSNTTGWGGWGLDRTAPFERWSQHLFATLVDTPERRTHGWRKKLTESPYAEETFVWGSDLLKQVVNDAIPRSLLHCDLINRNVLVDGAQISGIFDWGCSLYGDHLYELAWFDFWSPWHPGLDTTLLHLELERRWQTVGYVPEDKANRLTACYLHIGLDHLAYNAWLGDQENLLGTATRMKALVPIR